MRIKAARTHCSQRLPWIPSLRPSRRGSGVVWWEIRAKGSTVYLRTGFDWKTALKRILKAGTQIGDGPRESKVNSIGAKGSLRIGA